MAKLVKPNLLRGQIFDKLAECFGDSVLGMYDKKLRIELIDDAGSVVQFSLAPVVHKDLVEDEDCDKLVPIAEQIAVYEAANAAKTAKNESKKTTKTSTDKKKTDEVVSSTITPPADAANVEITPEEQAKLDELDKLLGEGNF